MCVRTQTTMPNLLSPTQSTIDTKSIDRGRIGMDYIYRVAHETAQFTCLSNFSNNRGLRCGRKHLQGKIIGTDPGRIPSC